jgi:hypothetical protein
MLINGIAVEEETNEGVKRGKLNLHDAADSAAADFSSYAARPFSVSFCRLLHSASFPFLASSTCRIDAIISRLECFFYYLN